ncbi:hypothetical protein GOV09_03565 [Candidatus Woesearchaeota archaeon]|nr:hypothetical protein [Candidatus Woesearchaeota archaeon]
MNAIVSIRVPSSLAKNLKEIVQKDHFLDVSETVRSIVRKRWLEWKDPTTYQVKKLREDIKEVVKEKSKLSKEELLLQELKRIKEMIEVEK